VISPILHIDMTFSTVKSSSLLSTTIFGTGEVLAVSRVGIARIYGKKRNWPFCSASGDDENVILRFEPFKISYRENFKLIVFFVLYGNI